MKILLNLIIVLVVVVEFISSKSSFNFNNNNNIRKLLLRNSSQRNNVQRDDHHHNKKINYLKQHFELADDREFLSERDFLKKFYISTNGPYWRNNTGWNTLSGGGNKDCNIVGENNGECNYCNWFGVKCIGDRDQQVLSLNLARNNLTGTLPTGIADSLQSVMIINLAFNAIGGQIPTEYGKIPSLSGIHVGSNHFEGVLPEGLCHVLSCDAYNNPKLKCPSDNCNRNHCNMEVCNCGGLTMCNSDADCYGKLCSKCVAINNGNPYFKICK